MKTYQSQYSTRKDLIPYQYDKQLHLIQIGDWEEPITDLIEVFPPAISDLQAQKDLAQIETALDDKIKELESLRELSQPSKRNGSRL
jgi:hypothetical protein